MTTNNIVFFDIESTGLLEDWIDYTSVPYRLKEGYEVHVLCAKLNGVKHKWKKANMHEFAPFFEQHKNKQWASHNGLWFDDLCARLALGVPVKTSIDTLIVSKVLFPDRPGGHSLESWGKRVGLEKMDFRQALIEAGALDPHAPRGEEFKVYHPLMDEYCETDVDVLERTYAALAKEMGDHDWSKALAIEHDIARSQALASHRGFAFNVAAAEAAVVDLDNKMQALKASIEPYIPEKPLTATALKAVTAPAKAYKQDGTLTVHMVNFMERNGLTEVPPLGKPLYTHERATLDDHAHIKQWLLSIGWIPQEWKERDLSVDSKKRPVAAEKYEAVVDRYLASTLGTPLEKFRLEYLEATAKSVKSRLMQRKYGKPMRVLGMPSFTVGVEKETCEGLVALGDKFPFAKEIALYYTYKHRRSVILGGGAEVDEDEDAEYDKGLLAYVREDGRIATPADTCGANTSRMRHKVCANIARVTSVYGKEMRGLFGVSEDCYQLGYDFASLEGRIEAHYCWKWDDIKDYCNALIQEKPNDVHTLLAKKISDTLNRAFTRASAKSLKYGSTYGAQVKKVAKMLGVDLETAQEILDAFWAAAEPLATLRDKVKAFWEKTGKKDYILGIDGRKLKARSPHSLVNLLFQSAGAIAAKIVAIRWEQKLEAAGLKQDWFGESLKKEYCQSIIKYHKHCGLSR